jgi:hypothetical protein
VQPFLDLSAFAWPEEEHPGPDPYVLADVAEISKPRPVHYLYATSNFTDPEKAKGQPVFPLRASLDGARTFYPMSLRHVSGEMEPASIFASRESHPWASQSMDWWAPEVWKVYAEKKVVVGGQLVVKAEPRYLALYSARKENGELAVGAALAKKPWEHFKDIGRPFIEDTDDDGRGVIDGTYAPFLDAVSWKKDGNHVVMVDGEPTKVPTPIFLQKVRFGDDTVERYGPIRKVIQNDQPWEGDLVEGPAFWKHGDRTFCFYSANCYLDERYAMGFAYTDDDPFSESCTWTKHEGAFIHSKSDFIAEAGLAGPGHCMVYPTADGSGDLEMAFHAWPIEALPTAREKEARAPHVLRLTFVDGMPQVVPGSLRAL